jgi:hypothetical protein
MKNQTFGIEIEMTGLTRYDAAKQLAKYFRTAERYIGGGYSAYEVTDTAGRVWKLMSDASIRAEKRGGGAADTDYRVKLVSPICRYGDIETVQEIVRLLRTAGARANETCGIHIHIGKDGHTARSLKNIVNIMASKEDMLFKALEVDPSRAGRWCKKVDDSLIERLSRGACLSEQAVRKAWYNGQDGANEHYHESRYHALNLHSVWQKGTVEFRCFNGTAIKHAGKIKAYIQLCLAISQQAKIQKCASAKKTVTTNEKFTFRTWLIRLGLNGDEFKTARKHLLEKLDGDIAWHDNRRVAA